MSLNPKLDDLISRLKQVTKNGNGWEACCPAHDDRRPSLSIAESDDGKILLTCHSNGCVPANIMQCAGMFAADMRPPKQNRGRAEWGKLVKTYEYQDENRVPLFEVCRFEKPEKLPDKSTRINKTFRQRHKVNNDWEWKMTGVRRVLYRLPQILAAPADQPIFVVEGEKAVEYLVSHGLHATCNPQGAGKWQDKFSETLRGRVVVIIPDNDPLTEKNGEVHCVGLEHAESVADSLTGKAKEVYVLTLPGAEEKWGLDDWLQKGGHELKELEELGDSAIEWVKGSKLFDRPNAALDGQSPECRLGQDGDTPRQPTMVGDKPVIMLSTLEAEINDEVLLALAKDQELFQRAGKLVHIVDSPSCDGINRPESSLRIVPVTLAGLREKLTRLVYFAELNERGDGEDDYKPKHPPKWCYEGIAARGCWPGVRPLTGVVAAPVLRPDGTVLSQPGYDPATGLYFDPQDVEFEIPDQPTRDDAVRSASSLLELVADFPFAKPQHRSTWLAFLLTTVSRFAFGGPAPLFLIDANVRGSGKSLLADLVSLIVTGREMSCMANPEKDDEMRKRITSLALAGDTLCLIDNVEGGLGCASLDAVLTCTMWKDRLLSRNEIVEVPINVTWSATGNNVVLKNDIPRRVAHIRLNSPLENPEERDGFKYPNIRAYVREHRSKLLADALTILAAFCRAGRPRQQLPTWGSFEGWSDLVRQAIVWCGLPDPGATRTELVEQSDREATALRQLIDGWDELDPDYQGLTTSEILSRLAEHPSRYDQVRNAVLELCPLKGRELQALTGSLGKKLGHLRGRVVSGRFLDRQPNRKKVSSWFVRPATAGDEGDEGGISNPFSRESSQPEAGTRHNQYEWGCETTPASPASPASIQTTDEREGELEWVA